MFHDQSLFLLFHKATHHQKHTFGIRQGFSYLMTFLSPHGRSVTAYITVKKDSHSNDYLSQASISRSTMLIVRFAA